jgi:hypothetical protein
MLTSTLLPLLLLDPVSAGSVLPPLAGEYLTGRKAQLPADAQGKVALLLFGFTYRSRFAVEKYAERFREAYSVREGITFFEIPMIGGMARLGKFFIDRGMRSGTPKPLHENVITVWGGVNPWKKRFGVTGANEDEAFLVILDRSGRVAWSDHGPFSEQRFRELCRRIEAAP